jgi:hypothetical protein
MSESDATASVVNDRVYAPPIVDVPPLAPQPAWSLLTRIAFRFYFAFAVMWLAPFPLDEIPGLSRLGIWVTRLWAWLVALGSRAVLHHPVNLLDSNGSGDRTANYVHLALLLILTTVATVAWSILDRQRRQYAQLQKWLHVMMRFYLGAVMTGYGYAKVFHSQFPYPSSWKLEQPYGDASPMGLLWTFMGYSTAYNVFTGMSEVVGAILLFFRRTATMGALVIIAVMTNVVMLNFCYDVPVKIYSTELLVAAFYIAAPRLPAIFDLLLRGRAIAAASPAPLFARRRLDFGARIIGIVFAVYVLGMGAYEYLARAREDVSRRVQMGSLAGLWDVEEFVRDGKVVPATGDDKTRWQMLGLSVYKRSGSLSFRQVDDFYERLFFDFDKDPDKKVLIFDGPPTLKWQYTQPDAEHLTLAGDYAGHALAMKLRRRPEREHRLETRGFHWINEAPYNR